MSGELGIINDGLKARHLTYIITIPDSSLFIIANIKSFSFDYMSSVTRIEQIFDWKFSEKNAAKFR